MWLLAPASSSAPHFDGHHLSALNFGGAPAVCACAGAIGASPYLPCAAPARAPAPAIPAVFKKLRRSAVGGELSDGSEWSLIWLLPGRPAWRTFVSARSGGVFVSDYPTPGLASPGHERLVRPRPLQRAAAGVADHRLSRQRQDHAAQPSRAAA